MDTNEKILKRVRLADLAGECAGSGLSVPSIASLQNWCKKGVVIRGERIKLQHERVGLRYLTTVEWFAQFAAACKGVSAEPTSEPAARAQKPSKGRPAIRSHATADAELKRKRI